MGPILYQVQFIALEPDDKVDAGKYQMPLPEVGDVYVDDNMPDFEVTRIVSASFDRRTAEVEGVWV